MANNFEFIFMSLLAISLSSLEKKILLFHLGYFSLYCLVERSFFFFNNMGTKSLLSIWFTDIFPFSQLPFNFFFFFFSL